MPASAFNLSMTETTLNIGDFDEVERIARELGTSLVAAGTLVGSVRGAANDVRDLRVDQVRLPGRSPLARRSGASFRSTVEKGGGWSVCDVRLVPQLVLA